MHEQAFKILEYNQLCELVRRYAQTPMGQLRLANLAPLTDANELQRSLDAVEECVELRRRGAGWSFSLSYDPTDSVARLRVEGAPLDSFAILGLSTICEQAMRARASILTEQEVAPQLWTIVKNIPSELNSLVARVSNKILPNGELNDRASPELGTIRHEITRLRAKITRTLESLMRRSEDAIQDQLVTIRNDRFVIPVKSDHQARIKGVAHGFSSSGATIFVEPMESIDLNNQIQTLREAEEREISRILIDLTEELRHALPAIELTVRAVAELDFINAKAAFYERFKCVIPEVDCATLTPGLEFTEARHPLLEENLRGSDAEVVPVSFSLDQANSAMIISGANAGGKTVVLKTAGLLSLMCISGLPVPARHARVPLYNSVLADIGDHQSLAANLSTFTSHMTNISTMLELCTPPALVLLDEIGTGTDPEEGSALGVAVIDHFRRDCSAHVIATTHYTGLKMYASNERGVVNATVEFDEKTLQPTYRLIVGLAGSSSGLEIARRSGIPNMIVEMASHYVSDTSLEASRYLQRIKTQAEQAEALTKALEEERLAVAERYASLDKVAQKHEQERQATFEKLLSETIGTFELRAREVVAEVHDRAERLKVERFAQQRLAELKREAARASSALRRKDSSAKPTDKSSRSIRVVRDGKLVDTTKSETDYSYAVSARREFKIGDTVRLRSFGSIGVVDQIKGDEAEVRVKSLRFREKLENLELLEKVCPSSSTSEQMPTLKYDTTEVNLSKSEDHGSKINVIGQRVDEAVEVVDKFLDEAALKNLSQVRIIHGHGTGALRRAIGELLKGHPHVARFSQAPADQGGAGATIVDLR